MLYLYKICSRAREKSERKKELKSYRAKIFLQNIEFKTYKRFYMYGKNDLLKYI